MLFRFILSVAVVSLAWAGNAIALPRPKVKAQVVDATHVMIKLDLGVGNRKSRQIEIQRLSDFTVKKLNVTSTRRQKIQILDSLLDEFAQQVY